MTERAIIMTGDSVRSILENRKTQTRRVRGLDAINANPDRWRLWGGEINSGWAFTDHPTQGEKGTVINVRCPYGEVGDLLWVRETWAMVDNDKGAACIQYRADIPDPEQYGPWRPSLFMPRWASRVSLRIMATGLERLRAINEADAHAEGLGMSPTLPHPRAWFREHWDSINARRGYGWNKNPWVWVITFSTIGNET